jgi:hypothetical protein
MAMKKFLNDPANLTPELLEGYCAAFADKVALTSEKIVVRATPKDASKVAIVTLGGQDMSRPSAASWATGCSMPRSWATSSRPGRAEGDRGARSDAA